MTELCFDALAQTLFGEDMSEARALVADTAAALHHFPPPARAVGRRRRGPGVARGAGGLDRAGPPRFRGRSRRCCRRRTGAASAQPPPRWTRRRHAAGGAAARRRRGEDLLSMLLAARDHTGAPMPERQICDEAVTMFLRRPRDRGQLADLGPVSSRPAPPAGPRWAPSWTGASGGGRARDHRVRREALRFTPAYRISRTAVQSCKLGGHAVGHGVEVMIPQWAVHPLGALLREA